MADLDEYFLEAIKSNRNCDRIHVIFDLYDVFMSFEGATSIKLMTYVMM